MLRRQLRWALTLEQPFKVARCGNTLSWSNHTRSLRELRCTGPPRRRGVLFFAKEPNAPTPSPGQQFRYTFAIWEPSHIHREARSRKLLLLPSWGVFPKLLTVAHLAAADFASDFEVWRDFLEDSEIPSIPSTKPSFSCLELDCVSESTESRNPRESLVKPRSPMLVLGIQKNVYEEISSPEILS